MAGLGTGMVPRSKDKRRSVRTEDIAERLESGVKLQTNTAKREGEGTATSEAAAPEKKAKPASHKNKLFTLTSGQNTLIEDLRKRVAPARMVNRVDVIRAGMVALTRLSEEEMIKLIDEVVQAEQDLELHDEIYKVK